MRSFGQIVGGLMLVLVAASGYAHSEHDKPRFVAANGEDGGDCADRFRPCATIAYAASRSNKGDRILLSAGSYSIRSADELFYVTSGVIRIEGGFNQGDYYAIRQPEQNPTTLVGVPAAFRDALSRQGFRVIADRKALGEAELSRAKLQLESYQHSQKSQSAAACVNGQADGFDCASVDLLSHVALGDLTSRPSAAADIWGFVDLNTGREYAIMGVRNGTAVVDVTDADQPFEVDTIGGGSTTWRDIKVHQFFDTARGRWQAYAYITADSASDRLTVIDLGGLPNSIALSGRETADTSAHNVTITNVNYSTGVAQTESVSPLLAIGGSNLDGGAFRTYQLSNPQAPTLTGQSVFGGYMHDGVAFILDDSRAAASCNGQPSCEILVDFNEGEFEISRLTGGAATLLASRTYNQASYVHSGWLSEDQTHLFVHDELDEQDFGLNTTLRVFDLSNLAAPTLAAVWTGPTSAIDHNGFTRGNRYYMSNYTRGLTVLDITDATNPVEAGFFDTFPSSDNANFNGAWGVYPYLPSGNLLVSDINSGLYVLRDTSQTLGDGSLSFTASSFGAAEGSQLSVMVDRQGGTGAASVGYRLIPGSAGTLDYTSSSQGRLSWTAGQTGVQQLTVDLVTDGVAEGTEQFFVELYDPQGGVTLVAPGFAHLFVSEPTATSEIVFSADDITVSESTGKALLTIQRDASVAGLVQVDYQTNSGSAAAGADFMTANGSVQWADGDATPRTIVLTLVDDTDAESDETFSVELSINQGSAVLGAASTATVTINDTDTAAPPPAPPTPPPAASGGGGGAVFWLLAGVLLVRLCRR